MSRAVRIHAAGGPEVLTLDTVEVGDPGPGQIRMRQTVCGVNFIDIYQRTGLYPLPLPATLGMEGVGVIDAIGEGVTGLSVGDRVGYPMVLGGYAEVRLIAADRVVRIPDGIEDTTAAGILLRGCTVQYLIRRIHPVQPGDVIINHAAAGGVGLLLSQWAKHLGATVIGTVSTPAKAELARAHGADRVVLPGEDLVAVAKEMTGGQGVPVVYDSIGKDTLMTSLDCLRPRGILVSFGNASGAPPAIEPGLLGAKGSLFLTRPSLGHYIATRAELEATAADLFAFLVSGKATVRVDQRFPLADAAAAHEALASRKTTGSTVLMV
ncbi:MAG: quinone oxidoreductase [Alphaproteobacteria bacterium]|nr:quinone oxidoreductase [Alphaproteobacteria bacterium]TAD89059.1 MAG: quinone oxidoreductase [Alphaproteobacteria bacterium]